MRIIRVFKRTLGWVLLGESVRVVWWTVLVDTRLCLAIFLYLLVCFLPLVGGLRVRPPKK